MWRMWLQKWLQLIYNKRVFKMLIKWNNSNFNHIDIDHIYRDNIWNCLKIDLKGERWIDKKIFDEIF